MYLCRFQEELGDGMVQEVQKLLWQLVCYTGNKNVVMSFVKGCLDNIEVNRYDYHHRSLDVFLFPGHPSIRFI